MLSSVYTVFAKVAASAALFVNDARPFSILKALPVSVSAKSVPAPTVKYVAHSPAEVSIIASVKRASVS